MYKIIQFCRSTSDILNSIFSSKLQVLPLGGYIASGFLFPLTILDIKLKVAGVSHHTENVVRKKGCTIFPLSRIYQHLNPRFWHRNGSTVISGCHCGKFLHDIILKYDNSTLLTLATSKFIQGLSWAQLQFNFTLGQVTLTEICYAQSHLKFKLHAKAYTQPWPLTVDALQK